MTNFTYVFSVSFQAGFKSENGKFVFSDQRIMAKINSFEISSFHLNFDRFF